MGTNFYLVHQPSCLETNHIGKRSAAGLYCWDCGETLCKGGTENVHEGGEWYDKCPKCGKEPEKEKLEKSSAGRELGFNKSKPQKKSGVKSCSSFSWGIHPTRVADALLELKTMGYACSQCGTRFDSPVQLVRDEYGGLLTSKEFWEIIEECPIIFLDSIGRDFS